MAVYRKQVYCELEFLKKFRNSYARLSLLDNGDAFDNLSHVSKFIQKSCVLLNVDAKTYLSNTRQNDTLKKLFKKASEGVFEMKFVGDSEHDHQYKDIDFLIWRPEGLKMSYLLNKKKNLCQHYSKSYGVAALSPLCWDISSAKDYRYLFRDCGSTIKKDMNIEWSHIFRNAEYKLCNCNSMLIVDNYIIKEPESNLFAIIRTLLPESLLNNTEFHLTIITEGDTTKIEQYANLYIKICSLVKKERPNLKCMVELYATNGKSDFHDRSILTNNSKIDSLAGFDLINSRGEARKETMVTIIHPGLQSFSDTCDQSYANILETAKNVIEGIEDAEDRHTAITMHWPVGGKTKNRLLQI